MVQFRFARALYVVVLGTFLAMKNSAAEEQWKFRISPIGSPPIGVELAVPDSAPITLSPNLGGGIVIFEKSASLDTTRGYFLPASLTARYDAGGREDIPLRLGGNPGTVWIAMEHVSEANCTIENINDVQQPSSDLTDNLDRYFKARALTLIQSGNMYCRSANRSLAAKAWFDRSYALATDKLNTYLQIDSAAAAAANNYYRPGYADVYLRAVETYELRLMNGRELAAAKVGQIDVAKQTAEAIITRLQADPNLATAAKVNHEVSLPQIKADVGYFNSLLSVK